ncbi:MAG TPA: LysR family transcriptional regulator [Casimicrobiaceae bacterium]
MEDSIGVTLFERTARGMMPTRAGVTLALRLKRALAEIRHAVADIAALRGTTQGTVTVGALPLSRTRRLPESIADVVGRHPGLRVATMEGTFEALVASLRAGDLDFILGALVLDRAARSATRYAARHRHHPTRGQRGVAGSEDLDGGNRSPMSSRARVCRLVDATSRLRWRFGRMIRAPAPCHDGASRRRRPAKQGR